MELRDVVRARRMVRAFTAEPVAPEVLDGIVDLARRAPAAGNTDGRAYVVLEGADTAQYWDVTLPAGPARDGFGWPGLVAAPVLVVVVVSPDRYAERYAEPDKARSGLGSGAGAWPVPYWFIDGGMAAEAILLGAVDAGLGACFFGLFDHEEAVLGELGVPEGWRAIGTIALGHPDAADRPGRSAARPRPRLDEVVHRGTW